MFSLVWCTLGGSYILSPFFFPLRPPSSHLTSPQDTFFFSHHLSNHRHHKLLLFHLLYDIYIYIYSILGFGFHTYLLYPLTIFFCLVLCWTSVFMIAARTYPLHLMIPNIQRSSPQLFFFCQDRVSSLSGSNFLLSLFFFCFFFWSGRGKGRDSRGQSHVVVVF